MTKPSLSIIIPCYDCESTLKEAVDSCFTQGVDDFEIILVDDGSKDGTKELMEQLSTKHPNIKSFFHEKNLGGGAARNTAVKNALSDVIFCLDSDDILPPSTLLSMLSYMKEKQCDAVGIHHSIKFIGTDKNNIHHIDTFGYADEVIPFESLLQKNGVLCPLYSTFMHTKGSFDKAGGYPTHHGFDTQGFAWRFLSSGNVAMTCPNASYLHRIENKPSYYVREVGQGKVNYHWKDIFLEHFTLFDDETKRFIQKFDCANFTRNIFDDLRKREIIFKDDYRDLLATDLKGSVTICEDGEQRKFIAQRSIRGLYLRIQSKAQHYFRIALEIARGRGWRVDLLGSLLYLRVRKAAKVDFAPEEARGESIDIVIPTVSKDHDLLLCSIESIKMHLMHPINAVHIISNESAEMREFCLKHSFDFINERDLYGYGPREIDYKVTGKNRAGWIFQQLLKLSGDKFVKMKNYLVVDSDTLLIRPHLFIKGGKFVFFQSEEYHSPYFRAFKNMFAYPVQSRLSLTCHMMIFNIELLKEMKDELETKHGMSWDKVYLSTIDDTESSCISDYDTYANWVHVNHPEKVLFTPFYNVSLARSFLAPLPELVKKYSDRYKSLSFHHYHEN